LAYPKVRSKESMSKSGIYKNYNMSLVLNQSHQQTKNKKPKRRQAEACLPLVQEVIASRIGGRGSVARSLLRFLAELVFESLLIKGLLEPPKHVLDHLVLVLVLDALVNERRSVKELCHAHVIHGARRFSSLTDVDLDEHPVEGGQVLLPVEVTLFHGGVVLRPSLCCRGGLGLAEDLMDDGEQNLHVGIHCPTVGRVHDELLGCGVGRNRDQDICLGVALRVSLEGNSRVPGPRGLGRDVGDTKQLGLRGAGLLNCTVIHVLLSLKLNVEQSVHGFGLTGRNYNFLSGRSPIAHKWRL